MSMKRIGIISDTHGDVNAAIKAVQQMPQVDFIIHLGDFVEDGKSLEKKVGIEVICVKGNCDFHSTVPEDRLLEVGGKRIFITHGHRYEVKWNYNRIYYKALEMRADVVLFGHTHIATRFIEEGLLIMNPGSVSQPRGRIEKTFGLLEIDDQIKGEILILG